LILVWKKSIFSIYITLSIDLLETCTPDDVNWDYQSRRSSAPIASGQLMGDFIYGGRPPVHAPGARECRDLGGHSGPSRLCRSHSGDRGFVSRFFYTAPLSLIVKQALAPQAPQRSDLKLGAGANRVSPCRRAAARFDPVDLLNGRRFATAYCSEIANPLRSAFTINPV
jgi:hypothetical protein